jgi:hypothetical protein
MKRILLHCARIGACCLLAAAVAAAGAAEPEFGLPHLESGRMVLSWSEFKTLLDELDAVKRELAELKPKDAAVEQPPVEYAIVSSHLRGLITSEFADISLRATVQVFVEGWTAIPFLPAHVGLDALTIAPEEDARTAHAGWPLRMGARANAAPPMAQVVRGRDGYDIVARGPAAFVVEARLKEPVRVENLAHTLTLTPPPAVMNTIALETHEKGFALEQATPSAQVTQTGDQTTIQAILGQHDEFRLVWKIDKDTGLHRKRSASIHALASIEKSALTMTATLALSALTALDQAILRLPAEVDILRVSSATIDGWSAEPTETGQRLTLTGAIDPRVPVEVTLAYRMALPELPARVALPMVVVEGLEVSEGFVGVEALGNLDVAPVDADAGFLIPAKNLPDDLWQATSAPLLHGYEFHSHDFSALLDIKRYQEIQTVVANADLAECVTHRTLAGKSMSRARYFIRNNDRQFLTLTLPAQSRIWQAFLDGEPVKPAQKDTGEVLIPMKKSGAQGEELPSFTIEIGYVTEVSKLSLKGDLVSELPGLDIPMSHLRWTLYVPEDYDYTNFEGPLKQVSEFSPSTVNLAGLETAIDIPMQGKAFLFEKFLMIDEIPYVRGKYGQYLGDDIYLTVQPQHLGALQQVTPMLRK